MKNKKIALITGITGQDGSYLAELLLEKGYEVHGMIRRSSSFNTGRIDHIFNKLTLHYGDMTDSLSIDNIIQKTKPDEIFHLAAQSHVHVSFDIPEYTGQVDALGTLKLLEAIRKHCPKSKTYNACTSELFGKTQEIPQTEKTPFYPRSPYGVAKLYSFWIAKNYREAYGMFVCNGILFNHESEKRTGNFVTKKITNALQRIRKDIDSSGTFETLKLGNMDAKRDWGYAPDYCFNLDVPILTNAGWKYYDDISIGDKIINFDIKKNCLTTDKIKEKVLLKTNGEKILLTGRGVYLNVTPEHRIYYQKKSNNSKGGWSDYKVCSALEMYNELKDKKNRTKYNYRLLHFQDYNKQDFLRYSDDELYLISCLLAEGSFSDYKKGRGSQISLSQSHIKNKKTHTKIEKTLKKLKIKYNIRNRNDGVTIWEFDSNSTKKTLKLFDGNDIHVMPKEFYNVSQRQAEVVFNAMMDCDGSWGGFTYFSSRYLLAVDFQTISHLAGYRTSDIKKRKEGCYNVGIITKRKKHMYIQEVKKNIDMANQVWCVKTNNKTVITRDGECINISGNCEGMYLMLQQDKPDDYILATNETHSIREFVEEAAKYIDMEIVWVGDGINEKGIDKRTNSIIVEIDEKYFRPAEVDLLIGDYSKAKEKLGWEPKVTFKELVKIMMTKD